MHHAVAKIDPQLALNDEERLVGFLVVVPDEVALQFDDFELVIVHLGNDFRLPLLIEQGEFLAHVDRLVAHGTPPSNGGGIISGAQTRSPGRIDEPAPG